MSENNSTMGLWMQMFGLDKLFEAANSPAFQEQIGQIIAAILETRIRCERIEYKLDALLDKLGHDDIARRPAVTFLPASGPNHGVGISTVASAVADPGNGTATEADRPAGDSTALAGGRVGGAEWRPYGVSK